MIITSGIDQSAGRRMHPLCCRYVVVCFESLLVKVGECDAQNAWRVHWALGASAEGTCEVLGSWLTPPAGGSPWREIVDELLSCGVERVRFLASVGASAMQAAQLGSTPLTLDSRGGGADLEPSPALPARLRHIVVSARTKSQLMDAELERSLRRHGPFDTTASACTFVEAALARLERRFWTEVPARAQRTHRRPHAALRAAVI